MSSLLPGSAHARPLDPRSNGADTARLLLRGSLGATMIAHGLRHARSLEGTAGWFGSIGFRRPMLQAQLSAVVEVGAGGALIAGLATPLAASSVVGTMAVAAQTVHRENGYFITDEGWEYVGLISVGALAIAALGPGDRSVDHAVGWDRFGSGLSRAAFVATIGVLGAAAQLKAFWSPPHSVE